MRGVRGAGESRFRSVATFYHCCSGGSRPKRNLQFGGWDRVSRVSWYPLAVSDIRGSSNAGMNECRSARRQSGRPVGTNPRLTHGDDFGTQKHMTSDNTTGSHASNQEQTSGGLAAD